MEVASSSLVTRSKKVRNVTTRSLFHMVPWPSGKARVCKTLIRQFKSGRYLQNKKHTKWCAFCFGKEMAIFEELNATPVDCCSRGVDRAKPLFSPLGEKMQTNLAGIPKNPSQHFDQHRRLPRRSAPRNDMGIISVQKIIKSKSPHSGPPHAG